MFTMSPQVVRPRLADQFVTNIRRLMEARGWTQKDLSEKSGVSENGISRVMTGTTQVRFDTIELLSDALNVAPSDLFVNDPQA